MKQSYPHITRSGSSVTIEARTMADADAAAEAELGPGFTVTSVRKLKRGGVGGFFASVMVELVATAPGAGPPSPHEAEMATAEELLRGLQRNDGDFAARLLDRLGDVDPDSMSLQELIAAGRGNAALDALAGTAWDDPWEGVPPAGPPRPALDGWPPAFDAVPDASFAGEDSLRTHELPAIADAIGPDLREPGGAPLARRRPSGFDEANPLAEMPPRPLRFDDDSGDWAVAPEDEAPTERPAAPDEAAAASASTVDQVVPAPPELVLPAHAAPAITEPVWAPPAAATPPPPAPPPAAPQPAAGGVEAVSTTLEMVAAAPEMPAPEMPAEDLLSLAPSGPSLAEIGWSFEAVEPAPGAPTTDLAVDVLTALPEIDTATVTAFAVAGELPIDPPVAIVRPYLLDVAAPVVELHPLDAAPASYDVEPADLYLEPGPRPADVDLAPAPLEPTDVDLEPGPLPTDADLTPTPLDDAPSWPSRAGARRALGLDDLLGPNRSTPSWRARPLPTVPAASAVDDAADHVSPDDGHDLGATAVVTPAADPAATVVVPDVPPAGTHGTSALPGTQAAFAAPSVHLDHRTDVDAETAAERPRPAEPVEPAQPPRTFRTLLLDAADDEAIPPAAPLAGGWSAQALFALGLPDRLVRTAAALGPRDDAEWTAALMLALRPLFGALPDGPTLLAGPSVATLAEQLGVPLLDAGVTSSERVVALATDDPAEVAATLDGRGLHLVVGGMWHELARFRPVAVSAAGPRFLLPAAAVADAWSVPLGLLAGIQPVRLDAVTIAMDIRATLGLDADDGPADRP